MNELVHLLAHDLADSWADHRNPKRLSLIALLEENTEPVTMGERGAGGKVTGSPAPWANDVEALLALIDVGARELETDLRRMLGFVQIPRGGSRINTLEALRRIPDLLDQLERARPDHWLVRGERHPRRGYRAGQVQRDLSTWHRQALILLGAERQHALLPSPCTGIIGEGDNAHECGKRAVRQRPGSGTFVCGACGETYTEAELHEWALAHATPATS